MRYKLVIEYDGTDYCGWQRQDNAISVQQKIEEAIYRFSGQNAVITGSGRTDSGVHAVGQVAHFDLLKKSEISPEKVRNALNFYLKGESIVILSVEEVDDSFHARFSSKKRYYRYKILNRYAPTVIDRRRVWHVNWGLDLKIMRDAAKFFEGYHNFSNFRSAHCQADSPFKTIESIDIIEYENSDICDIDFVAKSFLHNQVRIMVSVLIECAKGKFIASEIPSLFKQESRTGITSGVAPAYGLYFMEVYY